jgi:signal peptidase I
MNDELKSKPTEAAMPAPEVLREVEEAREERRDILRTLILCLFAVFVVRAFLVEPFKIPSSSMLPSLRIGDHIFVSKFDFGLALPFTNFQFLQWNGPDRGDVVVFLFPRDEWVHYVKRVVGVPGDKIEIRGREVRINGKVVERERFDKARYPDLAPTVEELGGDIFVEQLGNSKYLVRFTRAEPANVQLSESFSDVVPNDRYFVLGDNRDESYDSRSWGFVPRAYLRGKARMIWLSLNSEPNSSGVGKIRWERCGTIIY